MDSLASAFLSTWNEIEEFLEQQIGNQRWSSYADLIRRASEKNKVVRGLQDDLRGYTDLRNAIVHEYHEDHVIASPYAETVEDVKSLRNTLLSPPTLETFNRNVATCTADEMIVPVAQRMGQQRFSQLPVYKEGRLVAVLTAETIARWFAERMTTDGGILDGETVERVLEFTDETTAWKVLADRDTVFDAIELFEKVQNSGRILFAIVLTPGHSKTVQPCSIITISEIPRLHSLLRIRQ